ncbi:MAG: hypothetical protein ABIO70_31070 [Pseudomonadota bacterium]
MIPRRTLLGAALALLALLAGVLVLRARAPDGPDQPAVSSPPPPRASPPSAAPPSPGAVAVVVPPAEPTPPPPEDTAARDAVPEVVLAAGAEAFARGDMEAARRHFRAIVDESPDHPLAPYAAYKLAWCEANLGDPRAASVEIRRTIHWLRDEGRPEQSVTLREALADLAHFRSTIDTGEARGAGRHR